MNELLVWWYIFVNSNYDVLIMTITLLVVAALVWEIIRLNKKMDKLEHLVQKLDIYTQCFHQDLEEMEDRFKLMCKDVIELKTKSIKKGKK